MLRDKLVEIALQWQSKYGVAPQITSVISEFDAAMLVGMSESDYSDYMQDKTAVSKGADFVFQVGPWGCPHFPLQEPCMRLSPHTARVILLIISRFK